VYLCFSVSRFSSTTEGSQLLRGRHRRRRRRPRMPRVQRVRMVTSLVPIISMNMTYLEGDICKERNMPRGYDCDVMQNSQIEQLF